MVIMAFHRVNDDLPEDGLTCRSQKFEEFCKFFLAHFTVLSLAEQVEGCKSGRDMGGTLSITFDDGYRDNFEVAAPILKSLDLPATFFVTTGFIGSPTVPWWDRNLRVQPGWMSWDQVRALAGGKFEIGCHSHSHLDLGRADAQAVRADLLESQRTLTRELANPARLFAYPFGGRANISERSRALVRDLSFSCCLSCCGGTNSIGADPYDLNRIAVAEWFATPNQFGYELLRGRLNSVPSMS
jgi:peptidoglycan/xylan/chitin deacetylase (PgdA/CDA1 family)